jgi:RNA polymerase sigma factor (sigma-70 family)
MDITGDLDDFLGAFPVAEPSLASVRQSPAEADLIQRAAKGDEVAFAELIGQHQDLIFRLCLRWLPDVDDAREATQDTFIKAYFAIPRYRAEGKFSTWLYRIALNQCRDRLKSKENRKVKLTSPLPQSTGSTELVCHRPAPDEAAASAGDREKLLRAIDELPIKFREVVILCGLEGLTQEECAEILKISVRAVEGRFYRARKILAEKLSGILE